MKIGGCRPANDLPPIFQRKGLAEFGIDGLPGQVFGGFGVEYQAVEVKEQGFYHGRDCTKLPQTVVL